MKLLINKPIHSLAISYFADVVHVMDTIINEVVKEEARSLVEKVVQSERCGASSNGRGHVGVQSERCGA